MDISIIIVYYKSEEITKNCLKSIKQADLSGFSYEIIVVNNSAEDKQAEQEFKEIIPGIKFIQSEKNLGMGKGNNLGIKQAQGDFILILNADIIVKKGAIETLFNFIKNDSNIGLVAPKLLNSDNSLQISCFRFPKFWIPIVRRTFLGKFFKNYLDEFIMADFDRNNIREVDWIMGSCFLARKEALKKIGNFDPRYFMYLEDVDLCRSLWAAGYKVFYNPESEIIHDHGRASAKEKWYLAPFKNKLAQEHIKSWLRYFWKWK